MMTHRYQLLSGVTAVLLFIAIASSVISTVGAESSPAEIRNTLLRLNDQAIHDHVNIAINWLGNALIIMLGAFWFLRFKDEGIVNVTLASIAMCFGGLLLAAAQLPHLGAGALAAEYGATGSSADESVAAAARALLIMSSFGVALSMSLIAIATLLYSEVFLRTRAVPKPIAVIGLIAGPTTLVSYWLPRLFPVLWLFFKWLQIPLLLFLLAIGIWMVRAAMKDRDQGPVGLRSGATLAADEPVSF